MKRALKRGADSAEIGKIDLNVLTRAEGEDFEEGDEAAAAARGDAGGFFCWSHVQRVQIQDL